MIISSRLRVFEAIRTHSKKIFTSGVHGMRPFLLQSLPGINFLVFMLLKVGAGAIYFDYRFQVDKKYMDLLQKNGIKAYAWTVDDRNIDLHLMDLGIEAIAINKPAFIKCAIEKHDRVVYEENKRS